MGTGLGSEPLRSMLNRISRGKRVGQLLTLQARTASTYATLNTAGFRTLMLWGRVTAASGTGGLNLSVRFGSTWLGADHTFPCPTIQNGATGTLGWWGVFGDVTRLTGGTAGSVGQGDTLPMVLPDSILAGCLANDSSSYTYEIGYILA